MAEIKFTTGQKAIGAFISILLVLAGVGVFQWSYDRDYSKLYSDGSLIAREKFSVEMNRVYSNIKYDYQEDTCIRIGGRITTSDAGNKRCYYPSNYYTKLNRNLKNTGVTEQDSSSFYLITRGTDFYKYGTRGIVAGSLDQEYKHLKTVEDIKQFPVKYLTTFTPKDKTKYRLTWEIDKLKDINLADGKYSECKYEFGKILIDLKSECSKLEYAEVINSKNAIYFHFLPESGKQELNLKLVDPPLVNETDEYPHIFMNETFIYVVTESGDRLNITDNSGTEVNVKSIGKNKYEWNYIYTYQGDNYHPEIELDCNKNYTYDNETYTCGSINVNMSDPTKEVDIDDFNSTVIKKKLNQPEKVKFKKPKFDSGKFTYNLESSYNTFNIGDKIVLDPTITIEEYDAIDNSSYVGMRGEGATFSHVNLSDNIEQEALIILPFIVNSGSIVYDYSNNDEDGTLVGNTYKLDNQGYSFDGDGSSDRIDFSAAGDSDSIFLYSKFNITNDINTRNTGGKASIVSRYFGNDGIAISLNNSFVCNLKIKATLLSLYGPIINTNEINSGGLYYDNNTVYCILNGEIINQVVTNGVINYTSQSWTLGDRGVAGAGAGGANFTGNIYYSYLFDDIPSGYNVTTFSQCLHQETCNLFVPEGTQTVRFQNISTGSDKINVTVDDFRLNSGTIETRLNTWKPGMGYDDTDASLVAAWHFDGNAIDATGVNNGTVSGATVTEGLFDRAYEFDGINDNINCGDDASLNLSNELTISVWVNGNDLSIDGKDIVSKDSYLSYRLTSQNNKFKTTIRTSGFNDLLTDNTYNNNQLYNVVLTFKANDSIAIYVDGVLDALDESISTGNILSSLQPLRLGYNFVDGLYFNGTMDEVRIYNRSLSAQEVKDLYVKGSLSYDNSDWEALNVNANTVDYSSLDGAVACYIDSEIDSCGSNDGTLQGDAAWTASGIAIRDDVLELDGEDDYQNISSSQSLNFSNNNFSIMAWVKPEDLSPFRTILAKGRTSGAQTDENAEWYLDISGASNRLVFSVSNGTAIKSAIIANEFTINSYSFVSGIKEDNLMSLYVDGVLKDTENIEGIIQTTDNDLCIGMDCNRIGDDRFTWIGDIDEAVVINRSLSATEIMDIYLGSKERHANNEFLIANDTTIVQSEYRVTPQASRFLSPTMRFSQGLLSSLSVAEGLNVSLCPSLGGALNFSLDAGYYNPVTGILYQTGVLPDGYSACQYTHNITNPASTARDIYAYLNATDDRFTVNVNGIEIGPTPTFVLSALGASTSSLTTETLDANISLTTANRSFSYDLNWVGN